MTYATFDADIAKMNGMYQLDTINEPEFAKRLIQFYKIIGKEVLETEELIAEAEQVGGNMTSADSLRLRTGLADLLADIVVYCASEAKRWGIPLDATLSIVMSSNFSKLGADGLPIKDAETGKFEKGPNYWKPEPMIARMLQSLANSNMDTRVQGFDTLVGGKFPLDMDAITLAATAPSSPAAGDNPPTA